MLSFAPSATDETSEVSASEVHVLPSESSSNQSQPSSSYIVSGDVTERGDQDQDHQDENNHEEAEASTTAAVPWGGGEYGGSPGAWENEGKVDDDGNGSNSTEPPAALFASFNAAEKQHSTQGSGRSRRHLLQMSGSVAGGSQQDFPARFVSVSGTPLPIQTDEALFQNALQKIAGEPRIRTFPPLDYAIDVPLAAASVYGMQDKPYALVQFQVYGRFNDVDSAQSVGLEFYRRMAENKDKVCPSCLGIYPVFNNVQPRATAGAADPSPPPTLSARRRRRNLLQQLTAATNSDFTGPFSILFVYRFDAVKNPLYYSDVARAVHASTFTTAWSGASDPASIESYMQSLKNGNFVVQAISKTSGMGSSL